MKKIYSVPGGPIIVAWLSLAFCIVVGCACVIYPDPLWIAVSVFSVVLVLPCIYLIRRGYLSYVYISDYGIGNKHTNISWEDAFFTVYISDPSVYFGRGQVDVLYIDDHFLSLEECKERQSKLYVIITPKRCNDFLHNYKNKVCFVNNPNSKRHDIFLKHNDQFK